MAISGYLESWLVGEESRLSRESAQRDSAFCDHTRDKISLLDNGEAIRTYCYITDVIEMFLNILFFGKDIVYNVGGESVISIFDLANLISKKTKKYVELPNNSTPLEGNPKVVNISIEKYLKEFEKNDFLNLDVGLDRTIEWQRKIYE